MKRIIFGAIILSFGLLLKACNTTEPPPDGKKVTLKLKLEDVSCTEAWIELTTTNLQLPATITLKQYNPNNDSLSQNFVLNTQDSLLYIDSLLPNQTYKFHTTTQASSHTSNELNVTTMDTTSHIFNYQIFELGEPLTGNSSILYDVAILDANNIYAVGEIYVQDSIGQTILYNVIHWDGNNWKLKKVYFPTVCGDTSRTPYPSRAIYVFDDGKIWMSSSGDKIAILENGNQINQFCLPASVAMSINRIWGTSSNDLYIVGNSGKIAHYQNGIWQEISSGTTLALTDIYGKNDNEVYAAGINVPEVKGVVLKGNSNGFSVMINSEIISENELFDKLFGSLDAIWLDENNTIYTAGNLMFQYKNNKWDYVRSLPENYIGGNPGTYYRGFISSIRGNASNDYVIAGDRNTLKHFNGISWQQIGLPYNPQSPISLVAKQKGNTVVAVGSNGSKAFIILLNR